jgi:transposase-like protein
MVRTYKRKRPFRPEIPSDVLKNAVRNVISKAMSLRAAAITFNIPKSTLFDWVIKAKKRLNNNAVDDSGNEDNQSEEEPTPSKYATRQVFSQNEEMQLECISKSVQTYNLC